MNRADWDQKRQEERKQRERIARERTVGSTVTWLAEPVHVRQGSRTRVVGVCSDAADSVKAMYGVKS